MKSGVFGLLFAFYCGTAFAQQPSYNWTGFYIGASGGYGLVSSIWDEREGGFGGGQIGYNWQAGTVVVGIEADGLAGRISESDDNPRAPPISNTIGGMFSVRGRAGIAVDRILLYGTAGLASAQNEYYWAAERPDPLRLRPQFLTSMADTRWHSGWIIGLGLEYGITRNWSAKAEYTYARFRAEDYFNSAMINHYGFDMSSARLGVNYRF